MKFREYVKNQFQGYIEIIRSDNTLKFANKECDEYLTKRGMIHQKSCPYTAQQNARVERKHGQILKIARALQFQSGLLLFF